MTNFTIIKRVEIGLFIAGLFLMIIFGNNDLIKGIGLGIMIQSVLLYLFDFFAAARGRIYFDFLESL